MKIKLCKDCNWVKYDKTLPMFSYCKHPKTIESALNKITGEYDNIFALYCRSCKDYCGEDGTWWEPIITNHIIIGGVISPNSPRKKTFYSVFRDWLFSA